MYASKRLNSSLTTGAPAFDDGGKNPTTHHDTKQQLFPTKRKAREQDITRFFYNPTQKNHFLAHFKGFF